MGTFIIRNLSTLHDTNALAVVAAEMMARQHHDKSATEIAEDLSSLLQLLQINLTIQENSCCNKIVYTITDKEDSPA